MSIRPDALGRRELLSQKRLYSLIYTLKLKRSCEAVPLDQATFIWNCVILDSLTDFEMCQACSIFSFLFLTI